MSKSIWTAAKTGAKLEEELKKKNGHKQRVDHGKLLETGSYGLACKKIFHGALVPWNSTEYCEKVLVILENYIPYVLLSIYSMIDVYFY